MIVGATVGKNIVVGLTDGSVLLILISFSLSSLLNTYFILSFSIGLKELLAPMKVNLVGVLVGKSNRILVSSGFSNLERQLGICVGFCSSFWKGGCNSVLTSFWLPAADGGMR